MSGTERVRFRQEVALWALDRLTEIPVDPRHVGLCKCRLCGKRFLAIVAMYMNTKVSILQLDRQRIPYEGAYIHFRGDKLGEMTGRWPANENAPSNSRHMH